MCPNPSVPTTKATTRLTPDHVAKPRPSPQLRMMGTVRKLPQAHTIPPANPSGAKTTSKSPSSCGAANSDRMPTNRIPVAMRRTKCMPSAGRSKRRQTTELDPQKMEARKTPKIPNTALMLLAPSPLLLHWPTAGSVIVDCGLSCDCDHVLRLR